jgi:maltose/moltooligosaccharide transporter
MQPFRALVGDMVSEEQRNLGYSIQSFLINVGAVIGSLLPFVLNWAGVANVPEAGQKVAPTVIWSFYFGGGCLLLSVLWTAFTTKEYPPEEYAQYHDLDSDKPKIKTSFMQLLKETPPTMIKLGIVQFFSWFALFMMWVYTTSGIAGNVWHTAATDSTSAAFNEAGNWVGVIFAAYSLFAAIYAMFMTKLANKFGRKSVYMWSLMLGGIGLLSMVFIHDKYLLLISMLGIGIAWAAILAMPYAILSAVLPADKMGVYMGIFNATITIPQIAAGILGGVILSLVGGQAIVMLGVAGVSMLLAGFSVRFVK